MNVIDKKGKKRKYWKLFVTIFIGFVLLLVLLYVRMISVRSAAYESLHKDEIVPVRALEVYETQVWKTIDFLSRIKGSQAIDVNAEVGGSVLKKNAVLGQRVKKGDILIELQDKRKEYKLTEAKARLDSAKADLVELKRKYDQTLTLVEKGIVARDSLDSLSNQLKARTADVDALEASTELNQWDVDHLRVKAPIDGQIVGVYPDEGQEVSVGQLLVKLINNEVEKAVTGVDSKWARIIQPGLKVTISKDTNDYVEKTSGQIIGVSPSMDSQSGTYEVEAKILDNKYDWWAGEVVNLEIPIEQLQDIVLIPRDAVLSNNKELFVFIYKGGKAIKQPVTVTWINGDTGAIPSSIIPSGTQVIVEGHVGLAEGQSVDLN